MDKDENGIDDRTERLTEISLALVGATTGISGIYLGLLDGKWAVILIIFSFALFQSTSVAKYLKGVM